MTTPTQLEFGGIIVSVPESWQDISDQTETSDTVFTLAKDDGHGALQFSIALYKNGPIPNPSLADLMTMVCGVGEKRQLGEGFDVIEEEGESRVAARSYQWGDVFLRVWYVSDGRNIAFVTYNCDWGEQESEVADCEGIVRSIRFEAAPVPDTINFYSTADEYGEFSNFASFPITLKGKRWPTSEHYFQAQKFADKQHEEAIRKARSPMVAARMGRDRKKKLRRDWESVKVNIMREAVFAKFTQHDELKTLLLATGDAKIVEHTERDDYWGDGGDGSGKNMLGRILMQVREELRKDSE